MSIPPAAGMESGSLTQSTSGRSSVPEGSYTPRLLNAKGVLPGVFDVGAALHALWKYAQNRLVGNLRGK